MQKVDISAPLLSPTELHRVAADTEAIHGQAPSTSDAICKLILHSSKGRGGGTGFIVHPRIILTAGHCVLEREKHYFEKVEVIPGLQGDAAPFGTYESSSFHVHDKYFRKRTFNRDFGFIVLDREIPTPFVFGLKPEDGSAAAYSMCGYPADDIPGEELKRGNQVAFSNLQPNRREPNNFYFPGTFYPGQSGSPFFFTEAGQVLASGIYCGNAMGGLALGLRITTDGVLSEFDKIRSQL